MNPVFENLVLASRLLRVCRSHRLQRSSASIAIIVVLRPSVTIFSLRARTKLRPLFRASTFSLSSHRERASCVGSELVYHGRLLGSSLSSDRGLSFACSMTQDSSSRKGDSLLQIEIGGKARGARSTIVRNGDTSRHDV